MEEGGVGGGGFFRSLSRFRVFRLFVDVVFFRFVGFGVLFGIGNFLFFFFRRREEWRK